MSRKPLILIVDDNELIRTGCRTMFERAGFEVLLAGNGAEALEVARGSIPDVILLDLNMPVLNGWQTARVIADDARTAGLPVIAYTAECFGVSQRQLKAAGFRAHADKLLRVQAVIDLVNRCLAPEHRDSDWVEAAMPGHGPTEMRTAS